MKLKSPFKLTPYGEGIHYPGTVENLFITQKDLKKHFTYFDLTKDEALVISHTKKMVSILDIVPSFARKYTNRHPEKDGANCWNATLNWFNNKYGLTCTHDIEMFQVLQNDFFKIKECQLKYGDVISFWWRGIELSQGLEHTVIYIGDGYVWHKAGATKERPWTFEALESVAKCYLNDHQEEQGITFHRRKYV